MNKHLRRILFYFHGIYIQLKQWFSELSRTMQAVVVVVGVLLVGGIFYSLRSTPVTEEVATNNRQVKLELVSALSNNESSLPLLGIVTSTSEATIRAESSGKLNHVYKKLGDTVVAGQIIAEFENSAERAAVLQAEGAYDAAKAARDIARINSGQTSSSLDDAKTNALNAISSAYVTMDDAIRVKTDAAYVNPRSTTVHFNLSVPDANLTYSLESRRRSIENMLTTRDAHNRTLTKDSDLVTELNTVQSEAQLIKLYLDDLAVAYSKALVDTNYTQTAIDSGKASITAARSAIATAISSLTASKTSLNASVAAQAVAGKTTGDGDTVTSADAQVKSALGAYDGALSRLEKTIVRSPITGTLNSLSVSTGDFVSQFSQIGVVSNNGALEVVAYITEDDAKRVSVGNTVSIDSTTKGIVTRVASAIDPVTKKIEVRIGIVGTNAALVNGQSIRVDISPTPERASAQAQARPIVVPVSALKITPQGSFMFTVDQNNKLVAHEVVVGALMGDQVGIISGVTGDMSVVTDARGLKDGQVVTVATK